ncbi:MULTISPECIES: NAD(P)/FAD-dependent oxidoreductase [Pseudomonas]|uniref:Ferredoxin reductase n=1 Tax=Pseudomonas plecoglossicida TaxID=70775 RepID=A0ABX4TZC5_PSEDL|nr:MULTISPECIES: FAD-dependent oxidoreductase [Pseudomonas]ASD11720.1 hypothetical protein CD800_22590 [Pseudomonas aeruginosa]AZN50017.1 FAD-dependent oxidoreductase [Pseudomonas aeruginosa]ELB6583911.1 FAD-dependent oxidoreductase [Pseudomonas aeruginosa]ELK4933873.1 FAD-dependent oxidoreductase [Pseudomonas aeruginosa]MBN0213549.1 FAD-dependent oxidoreductase [Pseudomonas aeruginosa]
MGERRDTTLIVGAGHAGTAAAFFLREFGYQGRVLLLSAETQHPYQRPPLSKEYLLAQHSTPSLLKGKDSYARADIELCLQDDVLSITPASCQVKSSQGSYAYDHLILATGSQPRFMAAFGHADNLCYLSDWDDAGRIRQQLAEASRIVVLGGGFIGLEIASSACKMGKHVTVIERAPRLLSRVVSEAFAAFIRDIHLGNGIEFRLGEEVREVRRSTCGVRVDAVFLSDGQLLECDMLVIGVGSEPRMELATAAGLACASGVLVDEHCQTSDPFISAIGDCVAVCPSPGHQLPRRESVQNATEQARLVAARLTGRPMPPVQTPWFWSDQLQARINLAGERPAQGQVIVRRYGGDKVSMLYLQDQQLVAIEACNMPGDCLLARRTIGQNHSFDLARLVDADVPLKDALHFA